MNTRSMSGINSGGDGGDVFQNGDNVFTGTNTYNVNLPTSTVNPTLSTQLITKAFADATYAGGGAAGDVFLAGTNAFTGTNTFNTNRPTSSIVGGAGLASDDFITKADGDSIYGSGDGDAVLAGTNAFTGTNTFNTNRPTSSIVGGAGLASDDFITKADGDSIYGSGDGDAVLAGTNAFTGTNTFNTNRPTSSIGAGVGLASDDFITKADGDNLYSSGAGDAVLAAGTAVATQDFTGFNKFTQDTQFKSIIHADDEIIQDGTPATGTQGQSKLTQEASNSNQIKQDTAGEQGNSIYQLSSGGGAILNPAPNGSVFHQTGAGDIIRSEGKVQMALAPQFGTDCCNKTYVDSLAGGGFRGFQYQQTSGSATAVVPWIFSGTANPPFVNVGNSYSPVTGFFDASVADVGYWVFYLNATIISSALQIPTPAIQIIRSGTTTDLVRAFDNQGYQRGGPDAYATTNISSIVEVRVGDRIYAINGHNPVSAYFTNQYTNFGGYKIG